METPEDQKSVKNLSHFCPENSQNGQGSRNETGVSEMESP